MNKTRCPWCGKLIDKEADRIAWRHEKHAVPKYLHMATCSHCNRNYGQSAYSSYMVKLFLLDIGVLILGIILWSIFDFLSLSLAFLVLPLAFLAYLAPYEKLDDQGKTVDVDNTLRFNFEVTEKYVEIKRHEIYFLSSDFDDYPSISTVSPFTAEYLTRTKKFGIGMFLYNHSENYKYLDAGEVQIYDSNMKPAAKIKFNIDK